MVRQRSQRTERGASSIDSSTLSSMSEGSTASDAEPWEASAERYLVMVPNILRMSL